MTQLTVPKTHVIITFSKTKHFITSAQNETLKHLRDGDSIDLDGSRIRASTISVIMPIQEYYQNFPDQRPAEPAKELIIHDDAPIEKKAERSERSLRGLIAGMTMYVENHDAGPGVKAEIKKHSARYETLYGKQFVMDDIDRARCRSSFLERDSHGYKMPCQPCIGSVLGMAKQFA